MPYRHFQVVGDKYFARNQVKFSPDPPQIPNMRYIVKSMDFGDFSIFEGALCECRENLRPPGRLVGSETLFLDSF